MTPSNPPYSDPSGARVRKVPYVVTGRGTGPDAVPLSV